MVKISITVSRLRSIGLGWGPELPYECWRKTYTAKGSFKLAHSKTPPAALSHTQDGLCLAPEPTVIYYSLSIQFAFRCVWDRAFLLKAVWEIWCLCFGFVGCFSHRSAVVCHLLRSWWSCDWPDDTQLHHSPNNPCTDRQTARHLCQTHFRKLYYNTRNHFVYRRSFKEKRLNPI